MAIDTRSTAPPEPVAYDAFRLNRNWGERAVTVVAASLAVLIVATIAVLMGMA